MKDYSHVPVNRRRFLNDDVVEKVICSAIWLKDFRSDEEDITLPQQPWNVKEGIVVTGLRHCNCIVTICLLTGKRMSDFNNKIQGFITNKHNFVTREEAAKIAWDSGQLVEETDHLFSEDVW